MAQGRGNSQKEVGNMKVVIENCECGCKRKLIYDEEGDLSYVEWLEWCDEHYRTIRKRM